MAVNVCWPGLYRPNPNVYLSPEKGQPKRLSTKWVDFDTGENLSNTYWRKGAVDFSGDRPHVWVEDELSEAVFDKATKQAKKPFTQGRKVLKGRKLITYLLHPDKFKDISDIRPAIGMIPNVSAGGPGRPFVYALKVNWAVPVTLRTKPANRANPRGWYEGTGVVWAEQELAGLVEVYSAKSRRKKVWREVWVLPPDVAPTVINPQGNWQLIEAP